MPRSLVLNSTHQPLAVVPARRAVVLVLKEKAVVVASNGVVFRSERFQLPAPSVVRLRYFVNVPYRAHAALTRRAVFPAGYLSLGRWSVAAATMAWPTIDGSSPAFSASVASLMMGSAITSPAISHNVMKRSTAVGKLTAKTPWLLVVRGGL